MPGFAVGGLGSVLRSARLADFSPEQLGFLTYGRGVDTTRMRAELGFEPSFTTEEAFADFAAGLTPTGGRVERLLTAALDQLPPVDEPVRLSSVGAGDRG
jgi:UDP-glucose 4-epimerase